MRSFVAPFTGLDPNENYDIRRVLEKATSTGVPIEVGNETLNIKCFKCIY